MCVQRHLVTMLVNEGADVNAADNNGNTALHYAYAYSQAKVCTILEARGASLDIQNLDERMPKEMEGVSKRRLQPTELKLRARIRRRGAELSLAKFAFLLVCRYQAAHAVLLLVLAVARVQK